MRRSSVTVMRPVRSRCGASAAAAGPLLLLVLVARVVSALPADSRTDAIEAEEALDEVVDSIRERLMRELGITNNKPVLNSTAEEMEAVMEQYRNALAEMERQREQDEWEDEDEDPLEAFHDVVDEGWLRTRSRRSVHVRARTPSGLTSFFPLNEAGLGAHEQVQDAKLRLYLELVPGAAPAEVQLSVYRLTGGGRGGRRPRRVHQTGRRLRVAASGWYELNVTSAAQQWQARPERNHGLQVECRRCADTVRIVGGDGPRQQAPRLAIRTRTVGRSKRDSNGFLPRGSRGKPHGCRGGARSKCCRQEMFVDFDELGGFDFIINPRNFSAYYCRGRCPPSYNTATDHALLQGWIYRKWKREQRELPHGAAGSKTPPVSRTCCVPSKLTALPIAYKGEDGKPHFSYWEDVVALECKCS
ncbi:Bone morphogenetic protein 4 [Amphibalanus amphitrite]|uniref:Bone morphogenetic protein 4 n=1 Tax=Amphibalanus amphitrite TaxID=1232801 RepID=A0A6A4WH82_AMPAM|nr:univin-like [Amphibalanus amphitrite]XP_043236827.1 univin-like [Amphibalanus amphitrite]XP_043236828.1 univin-like [Amphibalanus amphitrite]KAF0302162.1 Bone morphogenetic protein 4 [Amphibalanus amphitrite]